MRPLDHAQLIKRASPPPVETSEWTVERGAELAFDDTCRLTLTRSWDPEKPRAAWLLTNPSEAHHAIDDPTSKRMVHFSKAIGCGSYVAVNMWPWRTPQPVALWRAIADGRVTPEMIAANIAAVERAAVSASVHIVAFGAEPMRRDRPHCIKTLYYFQSRARCNGTGDLLCLGVNQDGWPLHPVARGKHAIPNYRRPKPWAMPT